MNKNKSPYDVYLKKISCESFLPKKEIDENNIISILNWEKHQNIEGMEKVRYKTRKRVGKYRVKQKAEEGESGKEDSDIANEYANVIEETLI
ncbi:phage replisome organizer N-terminal domain-containing protein [Clostridium sp.]|uniref:phage replisome organizer N-terminal domain-containing protein n=1 Tax=Clostridium sp. TaxID=1506 RepID=UPI002840A6CD|nr:phage replisome organizer N-terminal domain-containing protein [Clostridium sp.]MDR3596965.1 phage replisome organizer N-terminal domain-containing protein [Clostridium sp.]